MAPVQLVLKSNLCFHHTDVDVGLTFGNKNSIGFDLSDIAVGTKVINISFNKGRCPES